MRRRDGRHAFKQSRGEEADFAVGDWFLESLLLVGGPNELKGTIPAGEVADARAIRGSQRRSPAGQRVLDVTGNLKEAQKLLGHASISTTGVYADLDIDQLAETMRIALGRR